jgi:hypothetical protein
MKPDCIGILTRQGEWNAGTSSQVEQPTEWESDAGVLTTMVADLLAPGDLLSLEASEGSWWVWIAYPEGTVCGLMNFQDPNVQRAAIKFEANRCGWLNVREEKPASPTRRSPPRTEPGLTPYQVSSQRLEDAHAHPEHTEEDRMASNESSPGIRIPVVETSESDSRFSPWNAQLQSSRPKTVPIVAVPVEHNWNLPSWREEQATPGEIKRDGPAPPTRSGELSWLRADVAAWMTRQVQLASTDLGVHLVANYLRRAASATGAPSWLNISIRGEASTDDPDLLVSAVEERALTAIHTEWRRQCARLDRRLEETLSPIPEFSKSPPERQAELP